MAKKPTANVFKIEDAWTPPLIKETPLGSYRVATQKDVDDLMAIAKAERNNFASNGKYVSLNELQSGGDITIRSRANYSYSAETTDSSFKIIAVYSGPDAKAPKRITVDETMAMTTE